MIHAVGAHSRAAAVLCTCNSQIWENKLPGEEKRARLHTHIYILQTPPATILGRTDFNKQRSSETQMLDFTSLKFVVNQGTPERAEIPLLRSLKRLRKALRAVKNTTGIITFVIQGR